MKSVISSSKMSGPERGPGFWRINPQLLNDSSYVSEMSDFLHAWTPPQEISSDVTIWEWLKQGFKTFLRLFLKMRVSEENRLLKDLDKELSDLIKKRDEGLPDLDFPIESIVRQIRRVE